MPAEPPGNSRQMSSQPKTQVSNKENALNSVTNVTVDHQYCFSAKSKSSCTDTAKIRQTQKLAKKIKAQSGAYRKRSQQTAGQTVKTVQETSQQQGCTAMEENTTKKHNKPHQILQPNKADNDTNENTGIHQVKVNAPALQVPVVEEIPTVVPNNPVTHNPTAGPDTSTRVQHEPKGPTAVKSKKKHKLKEVYQNQPKNTGSVTAKEEINGNMEEEINGKNNQVEKEKHEPAITSVVAPDLVCAEGRWHPFTVNPSCSHKVHCRHNPGMGLPQNVQKWFYECPNYLCEPAWIITARLAACIALRLTEEEGERFSSMTEDIQNTLR
ncbi:uncharacterized protein LOC115017589 isoform X2 [Cottoperca gobio]|nr:uncharacterized protein LOC115017589 isoform X2 [Cottoperca gobio]